MDEHEISYLTNLKTFAEDGLKWLDGNELWVQQYPYDTWTHPMFSDTTIDHDRAVKLKESFDKGVRGGKIFSDYEHGLDPAKGNKASGEVKELKVVDEARGAFTQPGLWARVQFTDTARAEIEAGEWNFASASHWDSWTDPKTQEKHELVYDGMGLTNKPYVKGMVPLNFSELGVADADAEAAAKEDAPAPVEIVEDTVVPVIDNKVDPVVDDEGGEDKVKLEDFQKELRAKLGLAEDADIITAVDGVMAEVTPMRDALKVHNEKKSFAEQYPEQAKRMETLEKHEQDRQAKAFSEGFANTRLTRKEGTEDKPTTEGYSALVLEKITNVAKKFSENSAEIGDVKELLDTIAANGIVDYGDHGSSREDEKVLFNEDAVANSGNMANIRKQFAEKVTDIMREDKVEYSAALTLAADKFPVLAEAYHTAGMG